MSLKARKRFSGPRELLWLIGAARYATTEASQFQYVPGGRTSFFPLLLQAKLIYILSNHQRHRERPYNLSNSFAQPGFLPLGLWASSLSKSRSVDRCSVRYNGQFLPCSWWYSRSQLGYAFSPWGTPVAFNRAASTENTVVVRLLPCRLPPPTKVPCHWPDC